MSDIDMANKLIELAVYYAQGGLTEDNPQLVNVVMEIGKALDDRGGLPEMQRIFDLVPSIRGKRTVEMQWDGVGSWLG